MADRLDAHFEAEDKKMLVFLKKLKTSDRYHVLSDATKLRINLYIQAYEGDADAMIALSKEVLYPDC